MDVWNPHLLSYKMDMLQNMVLLRIVQIEFDGDLRFLSQWPMCKLVLIQHNYTVHLRKEGYTQGKILVELNPV